MYIILHVKQLKTIYDEAALQSSNNINKIGNGNKTIYNSKFGKTFTLSNKRKNKNNGGYIKNDKSNKKIKKCIIQNPPKQSKYQKK